MLEATLTETDEAAARRFEDVWARRTTGSALPYDLADPKWRFISHLVDHHRVLVRGSNRIDVSVFEPVPQTDSFGRLRRAVFATSDPIWPIFFAVVDRSRYHGSVASRCEVTRDRSAVERRRYAFSINAVALAQRPFSSGAVYVLPRDDFERVTSDEGYGSEEWCRASAVRTLCYLRVEPDDFPFLNDVTGHGDDAWHEFEELAYLLAVKCSAVELEHRTCRFRFSEEPNVVDQLRAFTGLVRTLLPEMAVDVMASRPSETVLALSGPDDKVTQIAAAFLNWRS